MLILVILSVSGYMLMAAAIGTILSKFFYEREIIMDWADAGTFGWICGALWPVSPLLFACLGINKLLSKITF